MRTIITRADHIVIVIVEGVFFIRIVVVRRHAVAVVADVKVVAACALPDRLAH
jgi:hypothetical protein